MCYDIFAGLQLQVPLLPESDFDTDAEKMFELHEPRPRDDELQIESKF
jgi:hypothetical protein